MLPVLPGLVPRLRVRSSPSRLNFAHHILFGGTAYSLASPRRRSWPGKLVGDQAAELRKNLRSKVELPERLISAALAAAVLALGILKFLTASQLRRWPEWLGVLLALGIGDGGWLVYSAHAASSPEAQVASD